MTLTQSQEAVRERLNEQRMKQHEVACKDAEAKGLKHPAAPSPLEPEQIEYPKYLHKDWKKSENKGADHYVAGRSRLVNNAEEAAQAIKEGFSSDGPEKATAKKK